MHTKETVTVEDVIQVAKECSDAIRKREAVCLEAMLGIAEPLAFMQAVRDLKEVIDRCHPADVTPAIVSAWYKLGDLLPAPEPTK